MCQRENKSESRDSRGPAIGWSLVGFERVALLAFPEICKEIVSLISRRKGKEDCRLIGRSFTFGLEQSQWEWAADCYGCYCWSFADGSAWRCAVGTPPSIAVWGAHYRTTSYINYTICNGGRLKELFL